MDEEMIFRIIFWVLLLIIFIFNRLIPTIRAKKTNGKFMPDQEALENEGSVYLILRIVLFIFFAAFLAAYFLYPQWMKMFHFDLPTHFRWVGVLIGGIGVYIWLHSQAILGRYWSPQLQIQNKHKLINTGLYQWVRHPIYAGSIIWALGVALLTANSIFALAAVLITVGAFLRAIKEEKMLIRHFGNAYIKYMDQTGRFIPKLRRNMKLSSMLKFLYFGFTTVLFKRKKPIVGSIILTDRCNLSCKHCAVSNINAILYPYSRIKADMEKLYTEGVRVLLFYGGEPFLWEDQGITLRELVIEARRMGFLLVNVVTNGTFPLDLPEADLILVSLDGGREKHNKIRGDTYDLILKNIRNAASKNICLYMAINQINKTEIEKVCEIALKERNVKGISFNFHTPYPGTEYLKLSMDEKQNCCDRISKLMDQGYPILNLKSAFPYLVNNTFETPCYQCVIMENGKQWVCGRCIDIKGLCRECGYFFAAEYSLAFRGNLKVIIEMLKTYIRI